MLGQFCNWFINGIDDQYFPKICTFTFLFKLKDLKEGDFSLDADCEYMIRIYSTKDNADQINFQEQLTTFKSHIWKNQLFMEWFFVGGRNIGEICIPFKHEGFWISPFSWNSSYCMSRRVVHCRFFHWQKLSYMTDIIQAFWEHICAVKILRTITLGQTTPTCILFFQQW